MRHRRTLLIATFWMLSAVAVRTPASALSTNPLTLADCSANALDCCNPACKTSISACCVANQCGLATAGPTGTVFGKVGFQGQQVSCGVSIEQCVDECGAVAKACNAACCTGSLCGKRCITRCSTTESACVDSCRDLPGTFLDGAFFDTVTVKQDGRLLVVSGPFTCQEGARATVEVRVTEASTGAVGSATTRVKCAAGETQFRVAVRAAAARPFGLVGTATACGAARIDDRGKRLDAFQWCRDVVLLPEGAELRE